MAHEYEKRVDWLDRMLREIANRKLEIRYAADADLGIEGYAVCRRDSVLASGPSINDALVEFDRKHVK